ncbi:arylamine N-acetyltransferase [Paenibacillus sp. J2TS4]|uniref:arylamine N-acetyltransferase family protein n=1 Tax=Paenibacillus sp. J2TS4 TaxID=2807194 RepID=UPI001BCF994F|nr:arylamine N-acetyltransferase [Paenibacillus sp. J2TS4]
MSGLNALFRQRIGMPENEKITFAALDLVLELTAKSIPFENFSIIEQRASAITEDNLVCKLLVNKEGGLCYELNALLYFFLIDNSFHAVLTRGVVYNNDAQAYLTIGRTHATILLAHEDQTYLVDTGFGGNLPLTPVPLTGETVTSRNGAFRARKAHSEHGDYVLEMKLKHKDNDWRIGYAFDSGKPVGDVAELNEIQTIIAEHPDSPFNKHSLITRHTAQGSVTLTDTSLTQWTDGAVAKEKIDGGRFKELLKKHFSR